MKKKLLFSAFAIYAGAALSTTVTIVNSGFTFSPAAVTINLGDSVKFVLASAHDIVEVSQATWNASGNTQLSGGFSTPFSGGLILPAMLTAGMHYFVCGPHASMGMRGTITVQNSTGITENQLQSAVSVYPNPSNGKFQFAFNGLEQSKKSNLEIYNLLGEKIYESEITIPKSEINLGNQADGIYFIRFYSGQTVLTKKIIVQ